MKFDIIVGNPPYAKSGTSTHLEIMNNALNLCIDKLCFIMPSKPVTKQLDKEWYNMFKNAVCTKVEIADKKVFPNTNMDNTAIYYCDRHADPDADFSDMFNVDDKIYGMLSSECKLLVNKLSKFNNIKIHANLSNRTKDSKDRAKRSIKDGFYYLNVSRAGIKPGHGETKWLSVVLQETDVLSASEELDFLQSREKALNIIKCPNKEYGENLKSLMVDGKVLRFGLWLLQTDQHIINSHFRYVPDIDYTNTHNDSELLAACGFTEEEIKQVLGYLESFDFSQNRNDMVRNFKNA